MPKLMCKNEGCNNIASKHGYCEIHQPKLKKNKRTAYEHKNKPYYRDSRWKTVCMIVDQREHNCCQLCHKFVSGRRKQHHHIIPIQEKPELAFDADNIMLVCPICHIVAESKSKEFKKFPSYFNSPPTQNV